jgi:hypothetical protein
MNENYCHLINVTNTILSYTSKGSVISIIQRESMYDFDENIYFSNCNNINRLDLCKIYNNTFLSIEVIPVYKKIVELLKTSIELTLECNNKILSENRISRLKSSKIHYYQIMYYSVLILILYNLIVFYKYKVNKLK